MRRRTLLQSALAVPALSAQAAAVEEVAPRSELLGEMKTKLDRIQRLLAGRRIGGVLLSGVQNFSWLTAGLADNHIVITTETGAAALLVLDNGDRYVVASNSEMPRLMAEDLNGLGFQPLEFKWYEDKIQPDRKLALIRQAAGGRTIGTDTAYAGFPNVAAALQRLRYQFTESELRKYRWLGRNATEAVVSVCRQLRPGVSERDMETMASDALMRRGMRPTVLLMGADRRVLNFRHTTPSDNKLERYAFVNVCARRWGLVMSTGRFVHFGKLPDTLRKRVNASARITARFVAASTPGAQAGAILEAARSWYAEQGFPGELEKHHQGGAIGYAEREWVAVPGSTEVVHPSQGFAWNPIVDGALSFDTFVVHEKSAENISGIASWPAIEVEAGGANYRLPDILVR